MSYYYKRLMHSRDAQHRPIATIGGDYYDHEKLVRLRDEILALVPPDPASGAAAVQRLAAEHEREKNAEISE